MHLKNGLRTAVAMTIVGTASAQSVDDFLLAHPRPAGSGWSVSSATGRLSLGLPVASVPGEIPIHLGYRWDGSPQLTSTTPYGGSSTYSAFRGAFGAVHFGFIAQTSALGVPDLYVLEDGRAVEGWFPGSNFSSDVATGGAFNLPPKFGFAAQAPANVKVNGDYSLVTYDAAASDLGSWASAIPAPAGFPAPTAYKVVMDRSLARVYARLDALGQPLASGASAPLWAPVLWIDRFGHSVAFHWSMNSAGLPAGVAAVYGLKALNQRGKGLLLQWARPSSGGTLDWNLRADFIGLDLPSMVMKGSAGASTTVPSGFTQGTAVQDNLLPVAGPVLSATQLQVGASASLPVPSWIGSGQPIPAATAGAASAPTQSWTLAYDPATGVLNSLLDPRGLQTSFSYQAYTLDSPPQAASAKIGLSTLQFLGVTAATTTDTTPGSGQSWTTRSSTWSRTLPVSNGSAWLQPTWSSTAQSHFGSGSDTRQLKTSFATTVSSTSPIAAYLHAEPLSETVVDSSSGTTLSQSTHTYVGVGLANSLGQNLMDSLQQTFVSQRPGEPAFSTSAQSDATGLEQQGEIIMVGSSTAQTLSQVVEDHTDLLEPSRVTKRSIYPCDPTGVHVNGRDDVGTSYDANGLPTAKYRTDLSGDQLGESLAYDAEGRPSTVSNLASLPGVSGAQAGVAQRQQSNTYDSATGYLTGQSLSYSQDASASLGGHESSSATYSPSGQVLTQTDARGVTTTTSWDLRGRMLGWSRPGSSSLSFSYPDERTRVTSGTFTQAGATVTRTATERFDGFGRLLSRTGFTGITETPAYDLYGRVAGATRTNASGQVRSETISYDLLGRTTKITTPTGMSSTFTYAADGNLWKTTVQTLGSGGAAVASSSLWRDVLGRVWKVQNPDGSTQLASYDGQGHLVQLQQTDPSGTLIPAQTRSWTYNDLGLLLSKTEPETGTQSFGAFNGLGQPQSLGEASGTADARTRQFLYDGLGRLVQMNGSAGEALSFTYSGPFLTASSSQDALLGGLNQTYAYNGPGKLLSQETSTFADGTAFSLGYGYTALGELSSVSYPDGRVAAYGYDGYGRINAVTQTPSGGSAAALATASYDAWGNRSGLAFASGARDAWSTDATGLHLAKWLISYANSSSETRNYGYDTADGLNLAGEWTLSHDAEGRLSSAAGLGVSESFGYDAAHNNLSATATPATAGSFNNFGFASMPDDKLPALSATGATTGWITSARGEAANVGTALASSAVLGLGWDALGLDSVQGGGQAQSYLYAPSGLRAQIQDLVTPANNRRYAYASGGALMGEYLLGLSAPGAAISATLPADLSTTPATKPPVIQPTGPGEPCYTVAHITRPGSAAVATLGTTITFSASGTSSAGSTVAPLGWTFGDGSSATGSTVTHAFSQGGIYTVQVTAQGDGCDPGTDQMTVNVLPKLSSFTASSGTASPGQGVVLNWSVAGATQVSINGRPVTGSSLVVSPGASTTYTLVASNTGGSVSAVLTLSVSGAASTTWKRDLVYLEGQAIAEIDASGTHELHADHLGTPRVVTPSAGAAKGTPEGRQAFAPYGEAIPAQTSGYKPLTGFTGHLQADATGLVYMRGRYYSPAWHRFASSDQGEDPHSWNQFAYVGGSPMMAVDPSGMMDIHFPIWAEGVADYGPVPDNTGGGGGAPASDATFQSEVWAANNAEFPASQFGAGLTWSNGGASQALFGSSFTFNFKTVDGVMQYKFDAFSSSESSWGLKPKLGQFIAPTTASKVQVNKLHRTAPQLGPLFATDSAFLSQGASGGGLVPLSSPLPSGRILPGLVGKEELGAVLGIPGDFWDLAMQINAGLGQSNP